MVNISISGIKKAPFWVPRLGEGLFCRRFIASGLVGSRLVIPVGRCSHDPVAFAVLGRFAIFASDKVFGNHIESLGDFDGISVRGISDCGGIAYQLFVGAIDYLFAGLALKTGWHYEGRFLMKSLLGRKA